jgi:hypothetical protein
MADHFKSTHTYSDPGLDKENIYSYDLSIRMHADGLSYCIQDTSTNKFLHLESFNLGDPGQRYIPGEAERTDVTRLSQLVEGELSWLTQPFNKTRILYEAGSSTLVPEVLFAEEDKSAIFEFNVAGIPGEQNDLKHDLLRGAHAYNVYHIPQSISAFLERYFQGASLHHHSTAMIQSLLSKFRNIDTEKQLFVNTGQSHIDILQIRDKKLDYYNSFRYNTAEDFMYFLVFVVEQLKLNPESVQVVLLGEIERHSSLSDLLQRYIRNVSFIHRNTDHRYSFVFDQLPGHYYYNLLNASLCE